MFELPEGEGEKVNEVPFEIEVIEPGGKVVCTHDLYLHIDPRQNSVGHITS